MSTPIESNLAAGQLALFGELKKNWGWLLLSGIVSIALGGMIIAKWPASGL